MIGFVQHLVDTITLGSLYALLGLSIALIFGIMRLVNFAQGELVMVGAYGATMFVKNSPWPIVLLVTLLVPILFALAMERIAFRPVRGASEATLLVTSFAISYLLQNVAFLVYGATPRSINIAPSLGRSLHLGQVVVPILDFATVGAAIFLLIVLSIFFKKSVLGIQLRAAAEDFTTARILGVRANRVIAVAFAISGLLCGVAAYLLVAQTGEVYPTMGLNAILVAFVATTLGGLGSLPGAVIGGYLFGAMTTFLGAYLPAGGRVYTDAFGYALVIVVLIVRPQGLVVPRTARSRV